MHSYDAAGDDRKSRSGALRHACAAPAAKPKNLALISRNPFSRAGKLLPPAWRWPQPVTAPDDLGKHLKIIDAFHLADAKSSIIRLIRLAVKKRDHGPGGLVASRREPTGHNVGNIKSLDAFRRPR